MKKLKTREGETHKIGERGREKASTLPSKDAVFLI